MQKPVCYSWTGVLDEPLNLSGSQFLQPYNGNCNNLSRAVKISDDCKEGAFIANVQRAFGLSQLQGHGNPGPETPSIKEALLLAEQNVCCLGKWFREHRTWRPTAQVLESHSLRCSCRLQSVDTLHCVLCGALSCLLRSAQLPAWDPPDLATLSRKGDLFGRRPRPALASL